MHIPDNYLSPQTDAVMAVAMVPVWVHCIKKAVSLFMIEVSHSINMFFEAAFVNKAH
mgnify:CR=1 FL=1